MWRSQFPSLLVSLVIGIVGCDRPGKTGAGPQPTGQTGGAGPSFVYDDGGGCMYLFLFRNNKELSEALVVSADATGIKEGVNTFDLVAPPKNLSVQVNLYPRPQRRLRLCAAVPPEEWEDEPVVWKAISGRLTIERFPLDPQPKGQARTFRAKATIEGAVFRAPDGREAKTPHTLVLDGTVGWNP